MLSACGCNWAGSENNICDKTGKCQCRDNFQGEKCDKCKEGFAGDYCEKCDSKHQNSPYENGVCLRKIYILFHLINLVTNIICFISACTTCNWNRTSHCNDKGECICKKNVIGNKCEQCASGHSGFPECTCR